MPLPVVAIHGCFFEHIGSEILRRGFGGDDHLSIWLTDSNVFDLQFFSGRRVSENQLAEFLYASLTLNANHSFRLAHFGPVILKADAVQNPIEDSGFFGGICLLAQRGDWRLRRSVSAHQND